MALLCPFEDTCLSSEWCHGQRVRRKCCLQMQQGCKGVLKKKFFPCFSFRGIMRVKFRQNILDRDGCRTVSVSRSKRPWMSGVDGEAGFYAVRLWARSQLCVAVLNLLWFSEPASKAGPGSWALESWSTLVVVSPAQSRILMVGQVQREVCETHSPDIPECAGERMAVCSPGSFHCHLLSKGCGPWCRFLKTGGFPFQCLKKTSFEQSIFCHFSSFLNLEKYLTHTKRNVLKSSWICVPFHFCFVTSPFNNKWSKT